MRKNRTILVKLVISVIMISIVLSNILFVSNIYASQTTIGGVTVGPDPSVSTGNLETTGQKVLGIIQIVGIIIAVGVLMVLGIKYMMGSAEEKAEYKKTMIPYVIGAVLIFAASTIANAVFQFAQGI